MKIILSPSKTQNKKQLVNVKKLNLLNKDKTDKLFNILKGYSKSQFQGLMKIKNNLLDETYDNFQKIGLNPVSKEAIKLYQGVAFEQIKLDVYNQKQELYLNNHLIILSAMYGALRPNDFIKPYRLDMTMKPEGINLYEYWQDDINNLFKDEDKIINLASNEFSKMLKPLRDKLITIDFKDEDKNGKFKTISYNAKKARGEMVHQMIQNLVKDLESIKSLTINGYRYDDKQSSNKHIVFIKEYQ